MAKLDLTDVTSGYASTAAVNANNVAIEAAFDNTLSRDGTAPNYMNAALDMNGYPIQNVGRAVNSGDAISYAQLLEIASADENLTGVIPITWEFISLGDATYSLPLASTDKIDMYVVSSDGLIISPSSYIVNPTTQEITFLTSIPPAGEYIVVRLFGKIPEVSGSGVTISNVKRRYFFTVSGAEVDFITTTTLDLNATDVYLNGIRLIQTTDYTVSGVTVSLTSAATAGDIIEIVVTNSIVATSQNVLDAETAAISAVNSAASAAQSAIDASAAGAAAGAIAGGTGINWLVKSANFTCVNQDGILANTVLGSWTLTLPATPSIGMTISIVDTHGTMWLNPLIVSTGSVEPIMGIVEDFNIDVANAAFQLIYAGTFPGWRIL